MGSNCFKSERSKDSAKKEREVHKKQMKQLAEEAVKLRFEKLELQQQELANKQQQELEEKLKLIEKATIRQQQKDLEKRAFAHKKAWKQYNSAKVTNENESTNNKSVALPNHNTRHRNINFNQPSFSQSVQFNANQPRINKVKPPNRLNLKMEPAEKKGMYVLEKENVQSNAGAARVTRIRPAQRALFGDGVSKPTIIYYNNHFK